MRSTKARACWNCRGWARCVKSPETTTKPGWSRSISSSTPSDTRGRCGGPKWTSEMCRIVRRDLSELPAQYLANVGGDLDRRDGGDGAEDLAAVAAAQPEAAEGGQRQGRQRIGHHQPLPIQLRRYKLVDQLVDDGIPLDDFHATPLSFEDASLFERRPDPAIRPTQRPDAE